MVECISDKDDNTAENRRNHIKGPVTPDDLTILSFHLHRSPPYHKLVFVVFLLIKFAPAKRAKLMIELNIPTAVL